MKERIESVINLSTANGIQSKEIASIHLELFGGSSPICSTCPAQLRLAIKRIKHYYKEKWN